MSNDERCFPICEDHTRADWNQPTLEDDNCVLCRLFYLEAQEGLLEEWQQRAKRAEEAIAEINRPLNDQMARLNETVVRLNTELEAKDKEIEALRLLENVDVLTGAALGTFIKGGDIPNTIEGARLALVRQNLELKAKIAAIRTAVAPLFEDAYCHKTIPGKGFADVTFCKKLKGHDGPCMP